MKREKVAPVQVYRWEDQAARETPDLLVVEEPLEIRVGYGPADQRQQRSVSITMRTPGHDLELAVGFLYAEGILQQRSDLVSVDYCANVEREEEVGNVVKAEIAPGVEMDLGRLERHFYTTSSCGVCGKASLEAVAVQSCPVLRPDAPQVPAALLTTLPQRARAAQTVFRHTGGIHAASLFSAAGEPVAIYEDVGRHNAFDKLIGARWLQGEVPLSAHIALASGRLSFELVQKTLRAGIPILVAVGAPSSLAVDLAREFGQTLVGFVRDQRLNVYTHADRILFS